MFNGKFFSDNKAFCLNITIKCKGKKNFRAYAEDYGKKNSKYADRVLTAEGMRQIYFSFPVSPKALHICIINVDDVNDTDFEVEFSESRVRDYNVWIDLETRRFLDLALNFSQRCGFEQASSSGRIFQSDNSEFTIKYYPVLVDALSGNAINSPARIGHRTGNIEIAKTKFDNYTVAMRMIILLHEYSHKFKNPKIGLEISNEIGADINALYIYLGLGFSKIDAICVFANVFLKAQTKSNIERMRKIMDYIQKFENQEFAKIN